MPPRADITVYRMWMSWLLWPWNGAPCWRLPHSQASRYMASNPADRSCGQFVPVGPCDVSLRTRLYIVELVQCMHLIIFRLVGAVWTSIICSLYPVQLQLSAQLALAISAVSNIAAVVSTTDIGHQCCVQHSCSCQHNWHWPSVLCPT
jgi:hypothetical protein